MGHSSFIVTLFLMKLLTKTSTGILVELGNDAAPVPSIDIPALRRLCEEQTNFPKGFMSAGIRPVFPVSQSREDSIESLGDQDDLFPPLEKNEFQTFLRTGMLRELSIPFSKNFNMIFVKNISERNQLWMK